MALLSKRTFIGIASETTQGTAVAPVAGTAGDYLLAQDVEIKPVVEIHERDYYRSSFDRVPHVIGKQHSTIKFKTEIKTAGSANTPTTGFKAALKACGLSDAATSGTFIPLSDNVASMDSPATSCTIYVYKDSNLHIVKGCLGSVKFSFEAGKICFAEFDFQGVNVSITASSSLPSVTWESNTPKILESASVTIAGQASLIVNKMDIDCGNSITMREDTDVASGVKGFALVGRNPKGSATFEVYSDDAWTKFQAGTEGSTTLTLGSGTGTTIVFTLGQTQYQDVSYADQGGLLMHNAGLVFNGSSAGNDWISINFN